MIAMTGVSSFTGCHIARALQSAGYAVVGLLTRDLKDYQTPLLKKRLGHSQVAQWVENAPLGSQKFFDALSDRPIHFFINHGWDMSTYRQNSNVDDAERSLQENWQKLIPILQSKGAYCIHTGTVYERGEGGSPSHQALTDYGELKSRFWDYLSRELPGTVSKVVLPNPIGPLENPDKLLSSFWTKWRSGRAAVLHSPQWRRDNIRIETAVAPYLQAVRTASSKIYRPSEFVMTNRQLVEELQKLAHRAKLSTAEVHFEDTADSSSQWLARTNSAAPYDSTALQSYFDSWFLSRFSTDFD